MAHFLLIVDLPDVEDVSTGQFQISTLSQIRLFETKSKAIQLQPGSSKQLSRNVWLLDAENNWPSLSALTGLADTCKFKCDVYLLEGQTTQLTK